MRITVSIWSTEWSELHKFAYDTNRFGSKIVRNICVHGGWFFRNWISSKNYVKPIDSKQRIINCWLLNDLWKCVFVTLIYAEKVPLTQIIQFFFGNEHTHTHSFIVLANISQSTNLQRDTSSFSFFKQTFSTEIYALNGLNIWKTVTIFEKWERTQAWNAFFICLSTQVAARKLLFFLFIFFFLLLFTV